MAFHLLTEDKLTLFHNGKLITASSDHPHWHGLLAAYAKQDFDAVATLADAEAAVAGFMAAQESAVAARLAVQDGVVRFDGREVGPLATQHVLRMVNEHQDLASLVAFLERLAANPSARAREQTLEFVVANSLPISEDGRFMAYKRIRSDGKDVHSKTFDNSVGQVLSMERREVDDDPTRTCSYGFHVAALGYLKHYSGERLMAVVVDPADVVAVPVDYQNTKMRVCRYEVVAELDMALVTTDTPAWTRAVVDEEYEDRWSDEEESEAVYRFALAKVGESSAWFNDADGTFTADTPDNATHWWAVHDAYQQQRNQGGEVWMISRKGDAPYQPVFQMP